MIGNSSNNDRLGANRRDWPTMNYYLQSSIQHDWAFKDENKKTVSYNLHVTSNFLGDNYLINLWLRFIDHSSER